MSLQLILTRVHEPNPSDFHSSANIFVTSLKGYVGGANKVAADFAQAAAKGSNGLSTAAVAGLPGYEDKPVIERNADKTLTHYDYYLIHGDFEYHLSLDVVPGDEQTMQKMFQSFTII